MRAKTNFFKEPRSCCAGHDRLPQPESAVTLVVGVVTLGGAVAVVGEEERLHHWLADDSRDD